MFDECETKWDQGGGGISMMGRPPNSLQKTFKKNGFLKSKQVVYVHEVHDILHTIIFLSIFE